MAMQRDSSMDGVKATLGVGMATLVTVLVAVLLTTFSILSLVSARADLRLSDKASESMSVYYSADSEAEKWLADIDSQLKTSGSVAAGSYDTSGTTADGRQTYTKSFAMDGTRDLSVQIAVSGSISIEVIKWRVVTI